MTGISKFLMLLVGKPRAMRQDATGAAGAALQELFGPSMHVKMSCDAREVMKPSSPKDFKVRPWSPPGHGFAQHLWGAGVVACEWWIPGYNSKQNVFHGGYTVGRLLLPWGPVRPPSTRDHQPPTCKVSGLSRVLPAVRRGRVFSMPS
eukprot:Skav236669  [mRNA]  locus=scaffold338:254802:255245:- [translate_table: standard]